MQCNNLLQLWRSGVIFGSDNKNVVNKILSCKQLSTHQQMLPFIARRRSIENKMTDKLTDDERHLEGGNDVHLWNLLVFVRATLVTWYDKTMTLPVECQYLWVLTPPIKWYCLIRNIHPNYYYGPFELILSYTFPEFSLLSKRLKDFVQVHVKLTTRSYQDE